MAGRGCSALGTHVARELVGDLVRRGLVVRKVLYAREMR